MAIQLTRSQVAAFETAARASSILSVVGSFIIIGTFVAFPFFRKPINRLVFFATFGNLLTNVATLMSTSVLPKPGQPPSGLCEFQGLLIQWFMAADAFWILCMATNVFLVFFNGYDAQQLRHLEKWYFALSYGIPGIPVLAYVILGRTGHKIIGSATMWCWVAVDVEWMRIAFFYAPAWILIFAAITIYSITGYRIWQKSVELESISRDSNEATVRLASDLNTVDTFSEPHNIIVTTQIECNIREQNATSRSDSPDPERISIRSTSSTPMLSKLTNAQDLVSVPPFRPSSGITRVRLDDVEVQLDPRQGAKGRNGYKARIISTSRPETATYEPVVLSVPRPPGRGTSERHAAAMAYFQVAFLMFLALIVVWLPSSINRLHQFVHKDHKGLHFALNLMSAIVLPLQGTWNAIIYIFTTRAECRRAWSMVVEKIKGRPLTYQTKQQRFRTRVSASSQRMQESGANVDMHAIFKKSAQVHHIEASRTHKTDSGDWQGEPISP
ncbi:hypothetical protein yc1106_09912 [Curvularia clavata]|uniref:G-protein coupled receptors family 2 profile 2 domain-containing protein n=1 Tax=Curvularia clavata TaxID=95742 RepID=A0A9Q8ZMA1_CURCL|nr:hypothetical protein yc1106_09912 [Curvularia clavata]